MAVIMSILVIILCYTTLVVSKWAIGRYKKHRLLKQYGIPGPKPDFFTGNLEQLKKEPTPNGVITGWLKKYGNVFGYYMGDLPFIVINDLEMLKQVMIKDFHVFENRPAMVIDMKPIDQSILCVEGKRWKEVRSLLTPTFSSGKIKLMSNIVTKKVDVTVAEATKKAERNEPFDIYNLVQGLTLDVIADCAFAMKTHCQENTKDEFLVAVRKFLDDSHNRAVEYAYMFPFVRPLMNVLLNYTTVGKMSTLIANNVTQAIRTRQENSHIRSMDLLQLMIDYSKKDKAEGSSGMTDEEIVANAYIFLLAGYETTATALGFTFYLLITHPEVQERLFQEIDAAEDCDYATLQSLQYLDQVFNESLRLYPPLTGFITRACAQDHQVGKFTIPKGSHVYAPIWDIQHDPDLWRDPWKFDPERFSPENKGSINSMAFFPFGIGPRNCVGARFAQLEAKLAIFKLLKKFKFEMCEKTDHPISIICPTVIINPANGVWLKAVPRTA
uniref:Cytochrome P450 3A24 n=1 Tax=Parasteatoda tepidariorum TaxID=114398 RepID=A0A2L2YIP3_PARTP